MRPVAAVATAALVGVAAVGCGGLPLPGGVLVERTIAAGDGDPGTGNVRVLPPLPAQGASPKDVVQGFLAAQADAEDGYGIAQQFLAPGVAWATAGPVTIYAAATLTAAAAPSHMSSAAPSQERSPTSSAAPDPPQAATTVRTATGPTVLALPTVATVATVGVVLARIASLDAVGTYVPRSDPVTETFRLELIEGQWRIMSPPRGLQLTAGDLDRSYTASTLWWSNPTRTLLVPEVRWLPKVEAGRQTQLVRALLAGPSAALSGAVRTAVPSGISLDTSVTDTGSDIVVDLSEPAAALSAPAVRLLLLQLAATLEPTSTSAAVRLEVGGQPLPSTLSPQSLAIDQVAAYEPDTQAPQSPSVALVNDRITAVTGTGVLPTAASQGLAGHDLVVAVPQPRGGGIAAVVRSGRTEQLLVAAADGIVTPVGAAVPVGGDGVPTWSLDGTLVVPTPAGLLVRSAAGGVAVVRTPVALGAVSSVRLARDGVRLLVTAGGAAYLTTLSLGVSGPLLGAFVPLAPGFGTVTSGGWEQATSIDLVARTPSNGLVLLRLAVDGSQPEQVALPPTVGTTAVALATAPGVPVLVGGADTIAQLVSGFGWRTVAHGTAPAAPG